MLSNINNLLYFSFSKNTPPYLHRSINHAQFSKYARFHKNPLQIHMLCGTPNLSIFTKTSMPGGVLHTGINFYEKIGKLGVPYFLSFQQILMKLCILLNLG